MIQTQQISREPNLLATNTPASIHATCSIGRAPFASHPDDHSLIKRADAALYKARSGGNRACIR